MPRKKKVEVPVQAGPLRLDLGCGKNKKPGFVGVDILPFEGVDIVADLANKKWPWGDGTVDEIHASHFIEHLKPKQRVHFANESYRVMKTGATLFTVTPHWAASRAYGDVTHEWPPVSEFWFWYLNAEWRKVNAPHNQDYTCDFDSPPTIGYSMHPMSLGKSQDFISFATQMYKEFCQDMAVTLVKGARVKADPPAPVEPVKRKRGRPRKNPVQLAPGETVAVVPAPEAPVKRKRGRPRKNPLPEVIVSK